MSCSAVAGSMTAIRPRHLGQESGPVRSLSFSSAVALVPYEARRWLGALFPAALRESGRAGDAAGRRRVAVRPSFRPSADGLRASMLSLRS